MIFIAVNTPTKTFGAGICPDGWTVSKSFKVGSCGKVAPEPPTIRPANVVEEVKPIVELVDRVLNLDRKATNYSCQSSINPLVGEKQQSCVPTPGGDFKTIEACLDSGCGGMMSCEGGTEIGGVVFTKNSYAPIGMCCESLIQVTEKEKLTRKFCLVGCDNPGDVWYPLYNAFGPNTMYDSLLSYMVRELLEPVRNGQCVVGVEDMFIKKRFKRQ